MVYHEFHWTACWPNMHCLNICPTYNLIRWYVSKGKIPKNVKDLQNASTGLEKTINYILHFIGTLSHVLVPYLGGCDTFQMVPKMDQLAFQFTTRGRCIQGKHWRPISETKNFFLCFRKQSTLLSFYAAHSSGKLKGALVHYWAFLQYWSQTNSIEKAQQPSKLESRVRAYVKLCRPTQASKHATY